MYINTRSTVTFPVLDIHREDQSSTDDCVFAQRSACVSNSHVAKRDNLLSFICFSEFSTSICNQSINYRWRIFLFTALVSNEWSSVIIINFRSRSFALSTESFIIIIIGTISIDDTYAKITETFSYEKC